MKLLQINTSITSSWKTSISALLQTLRRVKIVIEETFSWGDFNPQINWGGMTVTAITIHRARYLKIWKMLWISVSFEGTVAAPLAATITIRVPGTAQGLITAIQAYIFRLFDGGAVAAGSALIRGGDNILEFQKLTAANYTAGAVTLRLNGFLEVI